jgi:hypothetical protein
MPFVKIRSWHIPRLTARGGGIRTLCGQWIAKPGKPAETFPSDEKTCETCLRLNAKAGR